MTARNLIVPISYGKHLAGDSKNCTVRALSNTTGKSIEDCTTQFDKVGREKNKGTFNFHKVYLENGLEFMGVYGTTKEARGVFHHSVFGENARFNASYYPYLFHRKKGTSLGSFIKDNPRGRFIVIIRGHATAIVDGKLVDTGALPAGKSVLMAYQVKD